jgi:hypothetical protein
MSTAAESNTQRSIDRLHNSTMSVSSEDDDNIQAQLASSTLHNDATSTSTQQHTPLVAGESERHTHVHNNDTKTVELDETVSTIDPDRVLPDSFRKQHVRIRSDASVLSSSSSTGPGRRHTVHSHSAGSVPGVAVTIAPVLMEHTAATTTTSTTASTTETMAAATGSSLSGLLAPVGGAPRRHSAIFPSTSKQLDKWEQHTTDDGMCVCVYMCVYVCVSLSSSPSSLSINLLSFIPPPSPIE